MATWAGIPARFVTLELGVIHPAIRDLFLGLSRHPAFQELLRGLPSGGDLSFSGLTTTAKAIYSVLLWQMTERPLAIVVDGNKRAEELFEATETFYSLLIGGRDAAAPQLLPALDVLPMQSMSPHAEICEQRAIGLWRLATRRVPITIMPVASALLRIEPGDFYRQLALSLRVGDEVPLQDVVAHLKSVGYERREPVEMVGEYSVRGGILDVFSPEAVKPLRVDLFGDLIESIRRFDVESQRSIAKTEDALLLPLTEYQRSRGLLVDLAERLQESGVPARDLPPPGEPFPGWELLVPMIRLRQHSVFSLLDRPVILWDEPAQVRGAAERLWKRLEQTPTSPAYDPANVFFHLAELESQAAGTVQIGLEEVEVVADAAAASFYVPTRPALSFHGNMPVAIAEARNLAEAGARVAFFAESNGAVERVADIFNEYGVPYQLGLEQSESPPEYLAGRAYMAGSVASIYLIRGAVRRGVVFRDADLAIFGTEDLFDTSELIARAPAGKSALATFSPDLIDLKPGDYVVHAEHGVARYLGLREIDHGEAQGDYMLLEYAAGAKLYVPLTRMDLVQRFRGAGDSVPALDRMGGATWTRTKTRVKAKMRDMADELLKLYAGRKMAEGFAFSHDSNWQREFEDAFEFTETRDQLSAIKEIKRDMESPQPMDRLLCGDVGYGKTEVVMRAAFKAMGDGKQVAVLAPTTVLTFQHYETFKRRFQPFPIRIEMLSRFRTAKEMKAVLADLAEGKVDLVVGTHRLLSPDVVFKDLGLVLVDEEQRFGVKHKERLKHLKQSVDVISMSATPIPRTLHMSLLGLRDMSVIETPPKDRLSIQTVVAHFQPDLIKSALELELGRGGQVYFLHNRVDSIWTRAASLQQLVPTARIGVGHGQIGEAELEKTMLKFMQHEYDIFVCTTIVENGLDIPLANTIIIENAERYGLAELYQLRGRVGRSNRRAYAYLLVPPDTDLTDVARKRLAALKEFSDLGAGFKIAALDLELRGAGNLLGGEQHGHINAVGFDMYVRLLEETVRELKGEEVPAEIHSSLNLGLDIRIPAEYIADENQRLRAYRQIANAATPGDRERVEKELEDRYGPVPDAVRNLLDYSGLKTAAEKLGIEVIDRRHAQLNVKFHPETHIDPARLMNLVSRTRGAQFTPAGVLILPLDGTSAPGEILGFLKQRFEQLQA
ncbi:MAG TPA: transcription-repair coupling factor [Bryobacteraceae bacterium]|nr:transcription-repair coupling factor [Bryobacteraceae bacterium]